MTKYLPEEVVLPEGGARGQYDLRGQIFSHIPDEQGNICFIIPNPPSIRGLFKDMAN